MATEHHAQFTASTGEYQAILARAWDTVARFPPLLQAQAQPLLTELAGGSFSRIVALLPYWLADLLDSLEPPDPNSTGANSVVFASAGTESVPGTHPPSWPDEAETLGLANLLGWWSYLIQDALLDGDLERPDLLPLATALHAAAVRLLASLLPGDQVFWDAFEALSLTTAEAHCWEQGGRTGLKGRVTVAAMAGFDNLDRLADRSALLQLSVVAQLRLRGYHQEHPLGKALVGMLRHYAIARQIGDDLGDWVDDLRDGRLNYVSARIGQRMVETGAVESCTELDVERMAGYFLYEDELLTAIHQVALSACRRARSSIAPYGSQHLEALVDELAGRLERSYGAALDRRRRLRAALAPLDPARRQTPKG
jgi:hypothetical protein